MKRNLYQELEQAKIELAAVDKNTISNATSAYAKLESIQREISDKKASRFNSAIFVLAFISAVAAIISAYPVVMSFFHHP